MRTTVEITAEQHRVLTALAQRRGTRGFSELVREALDAYLHDLSSEEVELLLSLEGSLGDEEAEELQRRISDVRKTWRAS